MDKSNYSVQGELYINGKCISPNNNDDESYVRFEDSISQGSSECSEWSIKKGKNVVLKQKKLPWYTHKKCSQEPNVIIKEEDSEDIIFSEQLEDENDSYGLDFNLIACILLFIILLLVIIRFYINNFNN